MQEISAVEFSLDKNFNFKLSDACQNPSSALYAECQTFRNDIMPKFTQPNAQMNRFFRFSEPFLVTSVPLNLKMTFPKDLNKGETTAQEKAFEHIMTLCLVYKESDFLSSFQFKSVVSIATLIALILIIALQSVS